MQSIACLHIGWFGWRFIALPSGNGLNTAPISLQLQPTCLEVKPHIIYTPVYAYCTTMYMLEYEYTINSHEFTRYRCIARAAAHVLCVQFRCLRKVKYILNIHTQFGEESACRHAHSTPASPQYRVDATSGIITN